MFKPQDKTNKKTSNSNNNSADKPKKFPVVIPYIRSFSEQLRRVFGGYGVPAYFKPTNTLRQILVRPKDPLKKEQVVGPVYHINCNSCEADYVGESERSLKARFSEHRRPSTTNSEVSQHIHLDQPDHTIDIDNSAKILAVEPKWFPRVVKEAIYIRAYRPSLNANRGRHDLSPIWYNTIDKNLGSKKTRTAARGARPSTLSPAQS